jgi:hypothetical protein
MAGIWVVPRRFYFKAFIQGFNFQVIATLRCYKAFVSQPSPVANGNCISAVTPGRPTL